MIFYVSTKRHAWTIRNYLSSRGRALASTLEPVAWDDLLRAGRARAGTWIFTDLERLSPGTLDSALRVWQRLEAAGPRVRLLNHPSRSMRRYELLRSLYERGSNAFDVQRLTEAREPTRYPVFLRGEHDHSGSRTPLLHSREELDAAVLEQERKGYARQRLLVIGFCDTSDARGLFRKYSAFRVGERILPRHVFFGKRWSLKEPEQVEPPLVAEERDYLERNPHEAELRELFELARIEYGRIDYAMLDGRIQVWEINTNPYLTTDGDYGGPLRAAVGRDFAAAMEPAWRALDPGPDAGPPIDLSPPDTTDRPSLAVRLAGKLRARLR